MKHKTILKLLSILVLCFLFSGCNSTESNEYTPPTLRPDYYEIYGTLPEEETRAPEHYENDFVSEFEPNVNYTECNGFFRSNESGIGSIVRVDDTTFVSDSKGIRRIDSDLVSTIIKSVDAGSIATDSNTILYTTQPDSDHNYSDKVCKIKSIDCNTLKEEELVTCSGNAEPIMIYDNKLYYHDYLDSSLSRFGLYIADLKTNTSELIESYVESPLCIGTTLYYPRHIDEFTCVLESFDYTTSTKKTISDTPIRKEFDCDDDKVYVCSSKDATNTEDAIYCYDPKTDEFTKIMSPEGPNLAIACVSDGYVFYSKNDSEDHPLIFMQAINSDTPIKIDTTLRPHKTHNCVIVYTEDGYKAFVNGELKPLNAPSGNYIEILEFIGQNFYMRGAEDFWTITITE